MSETRILVCARLREWLIVIVYVLLFLCANCNLLQCCCTRSLDPPEVNVLPYQRKVLREKTYSARLREWFFVKCVCVDVFVCNCNLMQCCWYALGAPAWGKCFNPTKERCHESRRTVLGCVSDLFCVMCMCWCLCVQLQLNAMLPILPSPSVSPPTRRSRYRLRCLTPKMGTAKVVAKVAKNM